MQQPLFRNGGKRRGAGRKPIGPLARASHAARPAIKPANAMHITLRVMSDLPSLRRPAAYAALRAATIAAARQPHFRLVHASIQHDHLHLIVEANDQGALARGMQSFQISAARQLNKLLARRGRVFEDRYHLVVIRSPTQMRRVLAYVLSNWRKHTADPRCAPGWLVDPYATGFAFAGWKELREGAALWPTSVTTRGLVVKPPGSWLLQRGWERGGPAISVFDAPGPPSSPPILRFDHAVHLIGEAHVVTLGPDGAPAWTATLEAPIAGAVALRGGELARDRRQRRRRARRRQLSAA